MFLKFSCGIVFLTKPNHKTNIPQLFDKYYTNIDHGHGRVTKQKKY